MDQRTRDQYPYVHKHWSRLGYLDTPQEPTLSNPPHMLFHKTQGGRRVFLGTDEEYELIMPAVRLASAYLSSPRSCAFLYAIKYGDRKPVARRLDDKSPVSNGKAKDATIAGSEWTEFERMHPDQCSSRKMRKLWKSLARIMTWGPKDTPHIGVTWGFESEQRSKNNRVGGYGLEIIFTRVFLNAIKDLDRTGRANSLQMLSMQFALATTLRHEVAHSVHILRFWEWEDQHRNLNADTRAILNPACEPFFNGQLTAELGIAWESEIFGGRLLDRSIEDMDDVSTIVDWPDGDIEIEIGGGRRMPYRGPQVGRLSGEYVVDLRYIQKVFRQDFWDGFWKSGRAERNLGAALVIPKTVTLLCDEYLAKNASEA